MLLTTPDTIRTLQRKLYAKAKAKAKQDTVFCHALNVRVRRHDILSRANKRRTGKCACFGMKNIGKPCAGKLHARFDEGGQVRACSLLYPCVCYLAFDDPLRLLVFARCAGWLL